jgi:CTP:molybdopterin cytidylyltransferase MocA
MPRSPALAGVILAAGASSRMGRDKALLPWRGQTLLEAHIALLQPETDLVIVVAGANAEALKPVVYSRAAFLIVNPQPQQGQFSSLRIGLQAVLNYGRDAAFIALVDRPPVTRETLRALKSEFCDALEHEQWAAVPDSNGTHGHPIAISREMIEAFLRAPAGSNARDVEHAHHDRIRYVPVADTAATTNWNTPEDYSKGLTELHS